MASSAAVPRRHLAIITCMDARIAPQHALGLELGDAHVLRNAGAVVSDDMLRSVLISQRMLGTRSVVVMAHTDCGLRELRDDALIAELEAESGEAPPFALGSFMDVDEHVRAQVERVRTCAWLPHVGDVRGVVLDISDGSVRDVV